MDARLQRRVQRYGWDRAVDAYEQSWRRQLEPVQLLMLEMAHLNQGDEVLDMACGTGLVSFRAAAAVGASGTVTGVDISGHMIDAANQIALKRGIQHVRFARHDAEEIPFADCAFDVALCGLGLMYVVDPEKAIAEMRRLLKPGGRAAVAVWGARERCGWAEVFPITDALVASEVCPMFFHLGTKDVLARAFETAGFVDIRSKRLQTTLCYDSASEAVAAVFQGGPVALAYSRFDQMTRLAVHAAYLQSIAAYAAGDGFQIPGEFVVVGARAPLS